MSQDTKKFYKVGGSVRDKLLGLPPKDVDYVVVGYSTDELIALGFKQVGKAFPVFLKDGQEYALARSEKKTIGGNNPHSDFEFKTSNVTLLEDLQRRDLTINAIAEDEHGNIIDPCNGRIDLENKILRHVSPAFIDDPLRVLRVARFAARFKDFSIAAETLDLMRTITQSEDFKRLSFERVYKEMSLALKSSKPSRFFYVLKEVGGLEFYFPEIHQLIDVPQNPIYHPEGCAFTHTMLVLDASTDTHSTYRDEIIFSALVHDLGKGVTPKEILPAHRGHDEAGLPLIRNFCHRLRIPIRLMNMAQMVCEYHIKYYQLESVGSPSGFVRLLTEMGAYKDKDKLEILVEVGIADELGKNRPEKRELSKLERAYNLTKDISFKDINAWTKKELIGNAIRQVRVNKLNKMQKEGLF